MSYLECKNLTKKYQSFNLSLSLEVNEGELLCILGPSGSGKSTFLSMISGLEMPDSGTVELGGIDITHMPIEKREIGFIFQDFSLFPNMNVEKNIEYGMKEKDKKKKKEFVEELLKLVELSGYEKRKVTSLSGGEAERIALARALAHEPKVLLLDEPLSALDPPLRKILRQRIREIHDALGITMLYVTHDTDEAFSIADRILIMREGKKEALGSAEELYLSSPTPFVFYFTGVGNEISKGSIYGTSEDQKFYFRPEDVRVTEEYVDAFSFPGHLVLQDAEIVSIEYNGIGYLIGMKWKNESIIAFSPSKPQKKYVNLLILKTKLKIFS